MHSIRLVAVVLTTLGVLAAACSSATTEGSSFKGGGGAGGSLNLSGNAGSSGSMDIDADTVDAGSPCSQETQYVYTVTSDNVLFKFDPPTLLFNQIGKLQCPNAGLGTPFSMSVDRKGIAWVVFTNGKIFWVDVKTAACSATAFVPNQHGFLTFGMGFATDAVGSFAETLYVTQSDTAAAVTGLAKIDTSTLELIPIAEYDQLQGKRAEMTGTGDARLFGAFEGQPYVVAEVDKQSAAILSQAPQSAIAYAPGSSNFAFAFWGGDFWLFVGPGTKTDVFQYKPGDGTTTLVKTVQDVIVGAGVSTCAPVKPPA